MTAYMLSSMIEIVIDTNVFVSALRSDGGAARQVLRKALQGHYRPVFGNALWLEYEDLLGRDVWTPATPRRPSASRCWRPWPEQGAGSPCTTAGARTCPMKATTI